MSLATLASAIKKGQDFASKASNAATKLQSTAEKVSGVVKSTAEQVSSVVKQGNELMSRGSDVATKLQSTASQISDEGNKMASTLGLSNPTNAPPSNAPPSNAPPTNAPPTNAPPSNENAFSSLKGLLSGETPNVIEIADDDKKKEILKAYRKIVEDNKAPIQDKILKAFDAALVHISSDKYVDDHFVKEFLHQVIFNQINSYYNKINTIYVQHIFLKHIFQKNKELIISALTTSVRMQGYSRSERIRNIFDSFRNQLAAHITASFNTNTKISGGDVNAVPTTQTILTQISKWFPIEKTQSEVSRDIAYIITDILPSYIVDIATNNRNRHYTEFNTKLSTALNKISNNITNTVEKVLLEPNTPELDIALLHASLSIEDKHYMKDTVLQCIDANIDNNIEITDANASDVAHQIYDTIMLTSDQTFKTTLSAQIPKQKGGRKRRKTRRYRKSAHNKHNKSTKKR